MIRFSAIISHPIQHFSPIFTQLAAKTNVEVNVMYLCDHGVKSSYDEGFDTSFAWDIPLTQGHDHVFLKPGFSPSTFSFLEVDSFKVIAELDKFKPNIIWLHGYAHRICWRALNWANKNNCKVVYFGDSELLHTRRLISRLIKRLVLPKFFARCDAFLTAGDNNEDYYRFYGVDDKKFYRAACPIDVSRFDIKKATRAKWREEVRRKFGIGATDTVLIFSGKLQDYKCPLDIVEAQRLMGRKNVHSLFIGSGPMYQNVVSKAAQLGIEEHVHLTGFVNQSEIPKLLSAGDIMVVPSERDAHPLAVSEALPFAMPIIASDKVGCVGPTDTARSNVNALIYPCGNIPSLADCITRLVDDDSLSEKLGEASLLIAPSQDVSVTADAILEVMS